VSGVARAVERPGRIDFPLLDALRILASFAVVRHHMRGDLLFGVGFGLPLFLVVLLGLATGSSKGEPPPAFARRKAAYLLAPWLRWSLVYVAILASADLARGRAPSARINPSMLFAGGEPSLWFLPFAAACMLPTRLLALAAERVGAARAAWIVAIAAAVSTFAADAAMQLSLPDLPFRAWLRVSPALLWGLALGQSLRVRGARDRAAVLLPVAAMAAAVLATPIVHGVEELPRRFGVAVLLACAGFGFPLPVPVAVRRLSTCTFGVYLLHPLVGKILGALFEVFAWPAWAHASAVWLLAIAGVAALRAAGLRWHELSTARPATAREATASPATDETVDSVTTALAEPGDPAVPTRRRVA
jgi:peptidoglycan/LPS O-acetylase OafA/YrhL